MVPAMRRGWAIIVTAFLCAGALAHYFFLADKSCAELPVCKTFGQCTNDGNGCVATSADDCTRSTDCVWNGACTLASGRCVVGSDDDCRSSKWACKKHGMCSRSDDKCVAKTDADCAGSEACKKRSDCLARNRVCVRALERPPVAESHGP
jgi:hypothetical protein